MDDSIALSCLYRRHIEELVHLTWRQGDMFLPLSLQAFPLELFPTSLRHEWHLYYESSARRVINL